MKLRSLLEPGRALTLVSETLVDRRRGFAQISYAQEGEDLILLRLFADQQSGFYVDVGAHHPKRFSNTYLFYKQGWRGVNIDAMPGSMEEFRRIRPRDLNIEVAIAGRPGSLTFYRFNDPALNTCDEQLARERNTGRYRILATEPVRAERLQDIFPRILSAGQQIDFLTVDVEGLDAEVLASNNWEMFRPTYVLTECGQGGIGDIMNGEQYRVLTGANYEFIAKTALTAFFVRKDRP